MIIVKFSPTALNFGYDFVLLVHLFLGHPVYIVNSWVLEEYAAISFPSQATNLDMCGQSHSESIHLDTEYVHYWSKLRDFFSSLQLFAFNSYNFDIAEEVFWGALCQNKFQNAFFVFWQIKLFRLNRQSLPFLAESTCLILLLWKSVKLSPQTCVIIALAKKREERVNLKNCPPTSIYQMGFPSSHLAQTKIDILALKMFQKPQPFQSKKEKSDTSL